MKPKNIDPFQIWAQLDQWFQRYDYHLVCGSIEKEQLKSYVYISGTTGSIEPKFGMGYYFWIS